MKRAINKIHDCKLMRLTTASKCNIERRKERERGRAGSADLCHSLLAVSLQPAVPLLAVSGQQTFSLEDQERVEPSVQRVLQHYCLRNTCRSQRQREISQASHKMQGRGSDVFGHYFSYKSQFTSRKHMLFVFHCLSISSLTPSPTPFSYSIVHDFFMKYIRKMILPHITNTEPDTGDHKSPAFTAHAYQVLRSTQAT